MQRISVWIICCNSAAITFLRGPKTTISRGWVIWELCGGRIRRTNYVDGNAEFASNMTSMSVTNKYLCLTIGFIACGWTLAMTHAAFPSHDISPQSRQIKILWFEAPSEFPIFLNVTWFNMFVLILLTNTHCSMPIGYRWEGGPCPLGVLHGIAVLWLCLNLEI